MRLVTYDVEVFKYNWLVVFKDFETGQFTCVWDDNDVLKECINEDCVYVGFNNKHYDQFIIKGICLDLTPQQIKQVNDYIIVQDGQGWDCPLLAESRCYFKNVDLMDDMQMGLSLKAIEGHLGMDIEETSVSFDIDRPLTEEEKRLTEHYCIHDVNTTEKLLNLRKDYLKNKIHIGKLAGLNEAKSMSMTNAKLTAALLQAEYKEHNDEREYVYPTNLLREHIPQEVFDFFDKLKDKSLSDKEVFSSKLEFKIGDCPVTIAYGGIHGAIPNFFWTERDYVTGRTRIILNFDVGSYYPHLMILCGYTSRNIPSPQIYENVVNERMIAKKAGDTAKAGALKLVVNTAYGGTLNRYNALYDPLMARSVCISGQLYLLELAMNVYKTLEDVNIVQLNTDGVMFEMYLDQYDDLLEIVNEWQSRTGFTLEEDKIAKIAQKDVNNYIEVQTDGSAKSKGGYLVRGIAPAGAFNVNNNACIVATALKEYFVNDIPVEETINSCTDIMQFQMIAKAGAKYSEAYHLVDGEKIPTQRVNRVYATADTRYGKLYKVKSETGAVAKIESLPEHCIIDNTNKLSIDDVDKSFYIDMAHKRINDFKGVKPEKKTNNRGTKTMASTTTKAADKQMNVYQKLIKARAEFLKSDVQKSGKNMHLSFKYFELDDIVPIVTAIFEKIGLIGITSFTDKSAFIRVINTDVPEETVEFFAPFNQIQPIVSNTGKQATNEMQALGSSITYMRRYLYMIALDICEADDIDANLGAPVPTPAPTKAKAPATQEQRAEVKQELTAPTGNASELQIKGLKNALKKLINLDPSANEIGTQIAVQTEGFTIISKKDCEKLIEKITAKIAEKNEGE